MPGAQIVHVHFGIAIRTKNLGKSFFTVQNYGTDYDNSVWNIHHHNCSVHDDAGRWCSFAIQLGRNSDYRSDHSALGKSLVTWLTKGIHAPVSDKNYL
jgi:hypothetical protein